MFGQHVRRLTFFRGTALRQAPDNQPPRTARSTLNLGSLGLLSLFVGGSVSYAFYLKTQKQLANQVARTEVEVQGRPDIGRLPWSLTNQFGERVTSESLKGEFALLYFGFTLCPDICPDEMEKQTEVILSLETEFPGQVQPVFITIDPNRDTQEILKSYCQEYSENLVGLRGTPEELSQIVKSFRVFYTTNKPLPGQTDYLIDHSIIHYLVDPRGDFVEFYSKAQCASEIRLKIKEHITAHAEKKKAQAARRVG